MKNKKICWKCCFDRAASFGLNPKDRSFCREWFNKNWQEGMVHCICAGMNINGTVYFGHSIKELPPERCPYLLEHTVNADEL